MLPGQISIDRKVGDLGYDRRTMVKRILYSELGNS